MLFIIIVLSWLCVLYLARYLIGVSRLFYELAEAFIFSYFKYAASPLTYFFDSTRRASGNIR